MAAGLCAHSDIFDAGCDEIFPPAACPYHFKTGLKAISLFIPKDE
jgi:hypothetical protein